MSEKKVICISLGRNETAVLKFLDSTRGYHSFDEIMEKFKEHPSISYESAMGNLIYRLKKKNLINHSTRKSDGMTFYQISKKGRLLLEVIKSES